MNSLYLMAPGAQNSDGPFSIDQAKELAKSEVITPETLFCEDKEGDFLPLSSSEELCIRVFENPKTSSGLKIRKKVTSRAADRDDTESAGSNKNEKIPASTKFKIFKPETETWEGPYSEEQLRDLADSNVISSNSKIRPEHRTTAVSIAEYSDLWERIKPVKRSALTLKAKNSETAPKSGTTSRNLKNKPVSSSPYDESADINKLLAASEGKTEKTKHIQRLKKSRARAVALLLPTIVISLLLFIASIVEPCWQDIVEMFKTGNYSFSLLTENWFLVFAITDLFLLIGIGLGQTGLFPLLRLRCGIGIGIFLYIFYSRGEWEAAGAFSLIQFAIIASTLSIRFSTTLLFSIISLGSGAAMIWLVWFKGIAL